MKTTNLMGREVIVTAGMIDSSTGRRIYGVFADEADARSIDADSLAIAVVGAADLTAEQIADAEANTEELTMTRDLNMTNLEAAAYDLMDYDSGACLGPATAEQVEASLDAEAHDGGAGVILVDDQGRVLRSDDRGASEARRCYVRD